MHTDEFNPCSGTIALADRFAQAWEIPAWGVGLLMVWALRMRICRDLWFWFQAGIRRMQGNPFGGKWLLAFGYTREYNAGLRETPYFTFPIHPAWTEVSRKQTIDAINSINEKEYREFGDPETLTRISQYEMAYRMQTSVPDVMDIREEPDYIHEMYGTEPGKTSFANNCLLARRLVEKGVRFVQLFDWGLGHAWCGRKRIPGQRPYH